MGANSDAATSTERSLGNDGAGNNAEGGSAHYTDVAVKYESAFFYSSPDYRDWVMKHLLCHFGLPHEDASIVDLGGGTGNFTQALAVTAQARRRVLCVDAFAEMLQQARAHHRVEPMLADAVEFAQLPPSSMRYSHVLLKELVHHIPEGQVPALYAGLYRQLVPGGTAVTITRPQEVDYPLFSRAREIWAQHQPHHSVFTTAMEAAGFTVELHTHSYQAELPKATWLGMMRDRFWSTFSHCTQQELDQGIAEVETEYAGQDTVKFSDRLLFLVARKPASNQETSNKDPSPAAAAAAAAGEEQSAAAGPAEAVLTAEQQQQYGELGFAGPVEVLSREDAAELHSQYEQYRRQLGGTVQGDWRFKSHLLLPWVWQLVHHPRILGAVSQALGGCRNLLCWSTDWFCKQPGDGAFTSWHQDSTYVALEPADVVTVWLALTPSDASNGGVCFQPGSHLTQLPHVDTSDSGNLLLKGQTIQELDGVEGQCVPLQPGQATLHHVRLAHRSGPAQPAAQPRLGLALRYMAAHVQQGLQTRDSVTVAAGIDSFRQYRHEQGPPAAGMDAAALEQHRQAVVAVYPAGFERGG
ncbi:hypothetical protein D9Q98_008743 [Chlorella vulgaris]|uniref:Methyltransferase domain-containing protein n=1 Tax=Chlorella vulgaris TaxID=3077 RepID=A0A9D4TIJ7_CHLVU|nr:hypothetical protein D9Q98_008743 [Chlorella vulgaris]